jgi:hypothetical protein
VIGENDMSRRSRREKREVSYVGMSKDSWYPDSAPRTERERVIHQLNLQAFPIEPYAKLDDVLVFSLFATKRRSRSYRGFDPTPISGARSITAAEGIAIAQVCFEGISQAKPTLESCHNVAMQLQAVYPHVFKGETVILEQLVGFNISCMVST